MGGDFISAAMQMKGVLCIVSIFFCSRPVLLGLVKVQNVKLYRSLILLMGTIADLLEANADIKRQTNFKNFLLLLYERILSNT